MLGIILVAAAVVRCERLGSLSFWYDEIVPMRLARTADPAALVRLLCKIEATRAPLQPLLLQGWVRAFGPSEGAARAFSVVCGVLTVAWVGRLGRVTTGDPRVGLWAAYLAALCPLLVLYSREVKMYAWLVLVTCAAWDALLSLAGAATPARLALFAASLVSLVYSHPLGLLMAAALGLASLVYRRALGLSWPAWLAPFAAAAVASAPWAGRYVDHEPEMLVGRLPLRFLLGLPIGFTGGNFVTLLGLLGVIGFGLVAVRRDGPGRPRVAADVPTGVGCLLIWLAVPPLLLYGYSRVAYPIFGPARYTLYVAPAYLILLARGLVKLPPGLGLAGGLVVAGLASSAWHSLVFAPDLKADWRAAALALDRKDPSRLEPVLVSVADPSHPTEAETARYYLGPHGRRAVPLPATPRDAARLVAASPTRVWVALGVREGVLRSPFPPNLRPRRDTPTLDVAGLRLIPVSAADVVP